MELLAIQVATFICVDQGSEVGVDAGEHVCLVSVIDAQENWSPILLEGEDSTLMVFC